MKNDTWPNGVVLSFDLDTKLLKKYYSINYTGAYKIIKNFLLKNGFEHNQDSDYINPNMTRVDAVDTLVDLSYKYTWFPLCVKKVNLSPNVEVLEVSNEIRNFINNENTLSNLLKSAQNQADIENNIKQDIHKKAKNIYR